MNTLAATRWTVERFLAWEDRQEGKHEFDGERIIPMTGGSITHQEIAFALMTALRARLLGQPFHVVWEMRVRMGRQVRYPDVLVSPRRHAGTTRTLTDALVIFEILSDDTAKIDRIDKPPVYAALPSLRRYVLLDQAEPCATVFARGTSAEPWALPETVTGGLALPELGITLPLGEIYADLPPPT